MTIDLKHIAELVSGEIVGDPATVVSGVSTIPEARPGDLVFAESRKLLVDAENSAAAAVLSSHKPSAVSKPVVVVPNARAAFTAVLGLFSPSSTFQPGIDRTAYVGQGATIGLGASIGYCTYIGDGARIDDDVIVFPHSYVGPGVVVGRGSILHPQVTLYPGTSIGQRVTIHSGCVIGSDGFGYNFVKGAHEKVPHIGGVLIEDDVEIGASTTIDRARTGNTTIGAGTKIDNLVHIAHNVKIGRNCIIVAQVGFSGSVTVGDNVVIAGQVGVKEHITIGSGAQIGAKSGIISDVEPGTKVAGFPARQYHDQMRIWAGVSRLPELMKKVKALEQMLGKLMNGPDKEGGEKAGKV